MNFDFNDANEQRSSDLIPADTIATVQMKIRPGRAGEDGWLRRSKDGDSEALDCEFTVIDGPYAKRRFWSLFTIKGMTEGHAMAEEISRARLRAILESARGIRPDDNSEAAQKARCTNGWEDFNEIRFIAKIGIEPAKAGFRAKNTLLEVITPNRKEWRQPDNTPALTAAAAAAAVTTPNPRPPWAR